MTLPTVANTASTGLSSVSDPGQYLTFMLRGEMYAIGILQVKEILEYTPPTIVPMMPPFIRGVINLRGAVVPVVDLGARFGGGLCEVTKRSCIVIAELSGHEDAQEIGVVVDSVSAVLELAAHDIEPAPAFGARIRAEFIQGMGKVNDNFLIILDVDKALSVDELAMAAQLGGRQKDEAECV